jgi:two-component system OmpR family response regulator
VTSVLVVEDDADIRDLLTTILATAVDEVLSCIDGQEALELAASRQLDLVVLDLALPGGLNGLDVLTRLRASGNRAKTMLLTAYAGADDRAAALAAGADAFVAKPFKITELVAQVRTLTAAAAEH